MMDASALSDNVGAPRQRSVPADEDFKCSVCRDVPTEMKNDGMMLGTPCKVCCKTTIRSGNIGVAGSSEMPTVLEFEGFGERLFVWRSKGMVFEESKTAPITRCRHSTTFTRACEGAWAQDAW